jgi:hypothetical protein
MVGWSDSRNAVLRVLLVRTEAESDMQSVNSRVCLILIRRSRDVRKSEVAEQTLYDLPYTRLRAAVLLLRLIEGVFRSDLLCSEGSCGDQQTLIDNKNSQ